MSSADSRQCIRSLGSTDAGFEGTDAIINHSMFSIFNPNHLSCRGFHGSCLCCEMRQNMGAMGVSWTWHHHDAHLGRRALCLDVHGFASTTMPAVSTTDTNPHFSAAFLSHTIQHHSNPSHTFIHTMPASWSTESNPNLALLTFRTPETSTAAPQHPYDPTNPARRTTDTQST